MRLLLWSLPLTLCAQTVLTLAIAEARPTPHWLWLLLCAAVAGMWAHQRVRQQWAAAEQHMDQIAQLAQDAGQVAEREPVLTDTLAARVVAWQQKAAASLAALQLRKAEAEELSVYKTALLQAVAHELRTPLNGIMGFTSLLLAGLEGPLSADRRENLEVIARASAQLLQRFNEAIELSTMASGQLSLRREDVHVGRLLEQVALSLEQERGSRPVHISLDGTDGELWVSGQEDRLQRVLQILGGVGLARTEAGLLRLTLRADAGFVEVAVLDGGAPWSTDDAQALFSPEQVRGSDARQRALRLGIARQLALLHGGELTAELGGDGGRLLLRLPRVLPQFVLDRNENGDV